MPTRCDLRIDRIVLREIRLPLKEPFRISSGVFDAKHVLLVELEQDGIRGWAECAALDLPIYIPDTVETSWLAIAEWLASRILQSRFRDPQEVSKALDANVRGHRMAKAALEMGCWEVAARLKGMSLARILGGTRRRVATGISLGIQESITALASTVHRVKADGYRRIKVKIKPGKDYEYLAAAKEAAGDVPVMADANSAYRISDLPQLKRLDSLGLLMIEQPLDWDDLAGHAALQREMETPICLDECVATPAHAESMITLDAGRIVNIKPGRVGGFSHSIAIHDICAKHDVPVWCGGMLESGVGRAHNVALASLPNFSMAGDLSPSSRYWARDIVRPAWEMETPGYLDVPMDKVGSGVDVDIDFVEDLTVRRAEFTRN
jgi:o-succinylbenzoate synthase